MQEADKSAEPFVAEDCLAELQELRRRHKTYIEDNKDLALDLDRLQCWLMDADLIGSEFDTEKCREAFKKVLMRLEEIAEDDQRLYDESPSLSKMEAVYRSTKDFEVKRDFERSLSKLL